MGSFKGCTRMFKHFRAVSSVLATYPIATYPDQKQLLNKRSKLIAKCGHENKLVPFNQLLSIICRFLLKKCVLYLEIFSRENYNLLLIYLKIVLT